MGIGDERGFYDLLEEARTIKASLGFVTTQGNRLDPTFSQLSVSF